MTEDRLVTPRAKLIVSLRLIQGSLGSAAETLDRPPGHETAPAVEGVVSWTWEGTGRGSFWHLLGVAVEGHALFVEVLGLEGTVHLVEGDGLLRLASGETLAGRTEGVVLVFRRFTVLERG
jgi:hypothetical protein